MTLCYLFRMVVWISLGQNGKDLYVMINNSSITSINCPFLMYIADRYYFDSAGILAENNKVIPQIWRN